MDSTLTQILQALYEAHVTIDSLRAEIEKLRAAEPAGNQDAGPDPTGTNDS